MYNMSKIEAVIKNKESVAKYRFYLNNIVSMFGYFMKYVFFSEFHKTQFFIGGFKFCKQLLYLTSARINPAEALGYLLFMLNSNKLI